MNQPYRQQHQPGRQPHQRPHVVYVQESDPLKWQPIYPEAHTNKTQTSHTACRTSRLPTLVALALLALAAALALIFWDDILASLGRIRDIGVSSDRGLSGFAVLGVVLVAIVAVVKILSQNRHN